MREITLTDTIGDLAEKNDPIHVYDTSGVYTDPTVQIDLRKGLSNIREAWIDERADTQTLDGMSSTFSNERLDDAELDALRFEFLRRQSVPKKVKMSPKCIMPSKALSPLKWSTLPFVKIVNGKITKTKSANKKAKFWRRYSGCYYC